MAATGVKMKRMKRVEAKTTTWFMVANPSIPRAQDQGVVKPKLEALFERIFQTNDGLRQVLKFDDYHEFYDDKYIEQVEYDCATEVGPNQHFTHANVTVRITHNTHGIKLHYEYIRRQMKLEFFGSEDSERDVHFRAKIIKDSLPGVLNYAHKDDHLGELEPVVQGD
jgi:hypothetical protein